MLLLLLLPLHELIDNLLHLISGFTAFLFSFIAFKLLVG